MALAMSASAIHAQTTLDPAEALRSLLLSLQDELSSTEMFITVFYGVVDRVRGELRYANAGHPHAFIVRGSGTVERLDALDPPLGLGIGAPSGATRPWSRREDLLVLFTDGVSDARNRADVRLGEQAVLDTVLAHRDLPPAEIVDRIHERVTSHRGDVPLRDDLTLVVLRS
jgi:sigma-B regulation protein RsbU (phosphoserine phosphatase)